VIRLVLFILYLRLHFMIVNLSFNYLTIKYYYTYCFKINLQPFILVSQSWFITSTTYCQKQTSTSFYNMGSSHKQPPSIPLGNFTSVLSCTTTSSRLLSAYALILRKTIVIIYLLSIANTRLYTFTSTHPVLHLS
jgi:hypothetical protein